ncbi:glycosyltransferase [Atrimonas thermophila]|uniref:glycosyltransferase n=1 Tax=Atrimonas thermophila TaxID=3064161 RepID=UPI00399CD0AC
MNKVFSVVVLTYNQEKLIEECLESIYNQDYPCIELIISDDASQDCTVETVERWLQRKSNRFVNTIFIKSPKNTGISANHTRGVRQAKGEFLKYIGGDDILLPGAIERMAKFLEGNKNVLIATSLIQPFIFNPQDGRTLLLPLMPEKWAVKVFQKPWQRQFGYMSRHCFLPAPGFFFRKKILEEIGYFDEEFRRFEDWHTWLKCLLKGYKIYFLPEVTVKWRLHPNSVSTSALYKSDRRFQEENLLVYQKYVLPNLHLLTIFEKIHVKARIKFIETLIANNGHISVLNKARMAYLLDPLKWIELPGWLWKKIFDKRGKEVKKLFS